MSANPFEFKCDNCDFATSHRAKLNFHKTKCGLVVEEQPVRRRRRRRAPARRASKGDKDGGEKKPRQVKEDG